MSIRKTLYVGGALLLIALAAGSIWLYQHRDFADPTWLDQVNALTVQAAWAQAILSVGAIAVAIVLGEVQHNRTRRQIERDEARRTSEAADRDRRVVVWTLYTLDQAKTLLELSKTMIGELKFKDKDAKISAADAAVLQPMIDLATHETLLLSAYTLTQLDLLNGKVHERVARAISSVQETRNKVHAVRQVCIAAVFKAATIENLLSSLADRCDESISNIQRAQDAIFEHHGLRIGDPQESAAGPDAPPAGEAE